MTAETERPFTEADLSACIKVLKAIAADRGALARVDREARLALLEAAGRVSAPERADQRRLAKAFRRKERLEERAEDEALLDETGIRTGRRAPVFLTPSAPRALLPDASPASPASPISPAGSSASEAPSAASSRSRAPENSGPELRSPRKCYVCKAEFRALHFFYDQLCPPCGDLNYRKRGQSADLRGRVALVTGARVKIGYQAAILLLRAGARVIVTTRFPHDAAQRYAREPDFAAFADRLEIHGLDLRLTPMVERFARELTERCERLDFILHNACQTVRRPAGFYAHLLEHEAAPLLSLPAHVRPLVDAHHQRKREIVADLDPARLSQASLTPEDTALAASAALFPRGALDADLQQVDLRPHNSWRAKLADVPTVELLEVQLVNAVAPFVLSGKLKPLMEKHATFDKHIVNVSAMEGQFYREHKTDKHPHTNMAKAALNMLTRTSAADYAASGIYMNSVDTGWVTDEDPADLAAKKREVHGFHPPLDIVDGAARICDPIFSGIATGKHAFGQFFKDYLPTDW